MTEDFGKYHPDAAQHRPYWENMAAWRNQVASETGVSGYVDPPAEQIEQVQQDMAVTEDRWVERLDPESNPEPSTYRFHDGDVLEATEGAETVVEPVLTEVDTRLLQGLQETLETYLGTSEATPVTFDPSEHNVPAVLEHLKGAVRTEVIRVLTAEKGGKARKGILNLEAELLAQANE